MKEPAGGKSGPQTVAGSPAGSLRPQCTPPSSGLFLSICPVLDWVRQLACRPPYCYPAQTRLIAVSGLGIRPMEFRMAVGASETRYRASPFGQASSASNRATFRDLSPNSTPTRCTGFPRCRYFSA